jgi:hypothetical protein
VGPLRRHFVCPVETRSSDAQRSNEIYIDDVVFYDPSKGIHRGRDEIDSIAGALRATHPDFTYQLIAEPEELGNGGRVPWVAGRPGDAPVYAERISSSPGTAGLPPFISSSTSCPEPGQR